MKKRNVAVSAMLIAVCLAALLTLAACGPGESGGEALRPQKLSGKTLIYDFENYRSDLEPLRLGTLFGSLDQNTDPTYVKSGKASLHIRPLGSRTDNNPPYFVLPTSSALHGFNYADFTEVRQVTFSVCNAETYDVKLYVGLSASPDHATLVAPDAFLLAPGWNEVTYEVRGEYLSLRYDVSKISGVYLRFENSGYAGRKAPSLYLDDVYFVQSSVPPQSFAVTLGENEICDFEQTYQKYLIESVCKQDIAKIDWEIVRASDYGLKATSGFHVLRFVLHAGARYPYAWPSLAITEPLLKAADLARYTAGADAESYELCFDLYSVDQDGTIGVEYYCDYLDPDSPERVPARSASGMYGAACARGEWRTYRQKLTTVDRNDYPGCKPIDWSKHAGELRLAVGQYYATGDTADHVYYVDNIRIEKANGK